MSGVLSALCRCVLFVGCKEKALPHSCLELVPPEKNGHTKFGQIWFLDHKEAV